MRAAMVNGLKHSIIFYAFAVLLTGVVHVVVGWENKSLVPKSTMVMILVTLVALPWSVLNISNLICPLKRFRNAGELIPHVVFLSSVWIFLNA